MVTAILVSTDDIQLTLMNHRDIVEPSQEGVIPPEFRTALRQSHSKSSFSPEQERHSAQERRAHNNWTNNPVELWSKEQVNSN